MKKRGNLRERIAQIIDEQRYSEAAKLDNRAVAVLKEFITSKDALLAAKAVHAASHLKPSLAVELIQEAAHSRQRIVRVAAAIVAPRLQEAGAPILEYLLKSKDASISKWAMRSAQRQRQEPG